MNIDGVENVINDIKNKREAIVSLQSTQWKEHKIENLDINTFFIKCDDVSMTKIKSIEYFLLNQDKFYSILMNFLLNIFVDIVDTYELDIEGCEEVLVETDDGYDFVPPSLEVDMLKDHVLLNGINVLEKKGEVFIEFDFHTSWNDEHGLIALVNNKKVLGYAEGGYCWFFDLNSDGSWGA